MDESQPVPLVLCMENAMGEEVSLQIEPSDDFKAFLKKAKLLLGFDVDINSVTRNQPVCLTDNIYDYLINSEYNQPGVPLDTHTDPQDDLLYILDDGTQICASQIHFDNDDPPIDLTIENIPFVKYADDGLDDDVDDVIRNDENTVNYNIIESPIQKWSSKNDSPKNFINNLPFKLVCNNTTGFEHQFNKYLESTNKTYATLNPVVNANKSPITLIKDNFKKYDNYKEDCYTREDILNIFKDSPVNSLPFEYTARKHVRKTDPSRIHKIFKSTMPYIDMNGVIIGETENQSCYICGRVIDYTEKLYLFDNKDQKLHKTQKKMETQLKVICEGCLDENFKPCHTKRPNQFLEPDEFLVIRNNQQFIFKRVKELNFIVPSKEIARDNVEIGYDGEIKTLDNPSVNVIEIKKDKESSSDVEIIEELDTIIDNLDDADEDVQEFLGKYQCDMVELEELKCRFCEKIFADLTDASDHCDVHKHNCDDGSVFPCPLCDYGYAKLKWLKAHLQTAHKKVKKEEPSQQDSKGDDIRHENTEKPNEETSNSTIVMNNIEVKMEVKQESVDISDDEIWIVRTADDEAEEQLQKLFVKGKESTNIDEKYPSCKNCNQVFPSAETLSAHKCRSARKRKARRDSYSICMPTKEDFIKRAQGRPVNVEEKRNDLLVVRPRKRRNKDSSMESPIVTCHNCNESFNSKVRLKFHMRFHEDTNLLTAEGKYKCHLCKELFECETTLFDHVHFQHHKNHRWMCPVVGCGKTFYLRATLTKHSRTHTDTRRYVCVTCGKRFLDKQTLDEHGVTHLQIKPFQCHICFKQLTRRSRLRMHLRAHEEELAPRLVYVCSICCRAFRDARDAQDHATKSPECIEAFADELKKETNASELHLSPTSGLVREAVTSQDSPKLSKPIEKQVDSDVAKSLLSVLADEVRCIIRVVEIEKAFRCEYCEDVFYLEDSLNNHRLVHKGVKNPFTCHICKVSFATYSRCTTHKTTHGFYKRPPQYSKNHNEGSSGQSSTGILGYGDFPVVKHFLCEDCGRSYLHWTYLQVHRRLKHPNEIFQHKCNQCDMIFPNSWSVAYHRKKMHEKSNPRGPGTATHKAREDYRIPCRDCDEELPNKTALYKHRKRVHSDMTHVMEEFQDTFECGNCGKQYGSRSGLDEHLKTHTDQNGVATCLRCNSTFSDINDLQKHLKDAHDSTQPQDHVGPSKQRPFPCGLCSHSFRTLSMREEHYRVHTGERPFPCDICGVAFRRLTAMRNHRLIHTGVRAWACARCPKRFRIRSDLKTHMKLKHPLHLAVIEITTPNPSTEEVMNILSQKNISHDRVVDVTKMSFSKGTTSVIPTCIRALSMLSNIPRVRIPYGKPLPEKIPMSDWQSYRRGRGIAKAYRHPLIVQSGPEQQSVGASYPMTMNLSDNQLSDLNMQLLFRDDVTTNGNQMVQIQLDDAILLQ